MDITHAFEVDQTVWVLDPENSTVLSCVVLQVSMRINATSEKILYILSTSCNTIQVEESDIYETVNDALIALGQIL